jgi:nucleoside-diphosphate-sugar epimerase
MEHRLKLQYLRIFQVFGEGEAETRLWPSLRKAALAGEDFSLTSGEQVRDFTNVSKVARDLVDSLSTFPNVDPGEPLVKHVSKGQPMSLKEFVEHWWDEWGAKGKLRFGEEPYRDGEVMRYVPEL